jgi:hypothetical protein
LEGKILGFQILVPVGIKLQNNSALLISKKKKIILKMIKEIIIKTEIIKILLRTYIETNKYTFI